MNIYLSVDSNWGAPNGFVDAIPAAGVRHVLFSFEKLAAQDTAPVIHYLNQQQDTQHHDNDQPQ